MNVSLKQIDAVSTILKVEIEKSDYSELLNKNLRSIRQKATMPGFRKGMVPFDLVKKMYGKQALAEELNKLVSESTSAYLRDNQVKFLGEPIPNETEKQTNDLLTDENFTFSFDIALSPEIDIQLSKEDTMTNYRVLIDDEVVDKQVDSYRKSYGTYEQADRVESEDLVKGAIVELEEGAPKSGGVVVEEAILMPSYLKGKMEQKKFLKAKAGDTIIFNPYKANKGAEAEIAAFLKIEKSQAKEMKSDFSFEIKEITRHIPAELNQEFFDKVFGKEAVKDETEFRDNLKASVASQYNSMTDSRLRNDLHNLLIQKTGDVAFADDILKRWLLFSNEKATKEAVEDDYPKVIRDLKYHLAKEKLIDTFDIKVEKEEIETMAKRIVYMQFAQYGIYSVEDEMLEKYSKEMMQKQDTVNELVNRVLDEKIVDLMKEKITIVEQEITMEELSKIDEEKLI